MPYANHRVVGVLELKSAGLECDSAYIRSELLESKFQPQVASVSMMRIDSASLQRDLIVELDSLRAEQYSHSV
jgi:hypothetical protein